MELALILPMNMRHRSRPPRCAVSIRKSQVTH
jgi:hypothetical protein